MFWMVGTTEEGPKWDIGTRLVIGWSERRQTYWMQLLDDDSEGVLDSINLPDTTSHLDDFDDLAEAAIVWKGSDDDDEITEWIGTPALIDQIMAASGRSWSY